MTHQKILDNISLSKINLFGLTQKKLNDFFLELGEKPYRTKQLMQWLYVKDSQTFSDMSNLSKVLINKLDNLASLEIPNVQQCHHSKDGTIKWVIDLDNHNHIETVYIPQNNRGTLCISSQVGCALDCSFCSTGKQGFNRNLTTAEIITQVVLANRAVKTLNQRITNVVFMGMGEPLLNESCVYDACDLLLDDLAFGLSRRKVTVSTSGVVPAIERLTQILPVSLAISLHASYDDLRNKLVPINQKYPIQELFKACRLYLSAGTQQRHILFEYVMLAGVNDSPADAKQLAQLLLKLPQKSAKVNLIPFNPFTGSDYQTSSVKIILKFQDILHANGIRATTRQARGNDIIAACGQLAGKVKNRRKHNVNI